MKVFVILLVAALAGCAGYLFGTAAGRERKQELLERLHQRAEHAADMATEAVDDGVAAGPVEQIAS